MTSGQRGGLALAFVAVIGVALVRPVLTADGDPSSAPKPAPSETPTEEPSPSPTETTTPTPTPTPTPTETPEPDVPPDELATAFPDDCLDPQPLPEEPGAIAAISERGTVIASPTGDVQARITGADGPVGFSPSGEHLLTGAGLLFGLDGGGAGPMFGDAVLAWAWSPQADCALAVDEDGRLLVASPDAEPSVLIDDIPVLNFALSATRLAISTEPGIISTYNLRSGRLVGDPAPLKGGSESHLIGWRGASLLYAAGDGRSFTVRSITARPGGTRSDRFAGNVGPFGVSACGDRLLGVSPDGDLLDIETGDNFGDPAYDYAAPACSPDGAFIAVARKPDGAPESEFRMVFLESDGTFREPVATGGQGAETAAEWSPSGERLVFLKATKGGALEVWYAAAEGGGASGIRVAPARGSADWNVTPPTGLPAQ